MEVSIAQFDAADLERFSALNRLHILDTAPEIGFDDIVLLATQLCHTPVALVSLVDKERQWFKARIGFPPCETPLNQSVCAHALRQDKTLVIPDLTLDDRTKHNTLVTEDPFIRFYAGALLRSHDGVPIGTLCVIDTTPRPAGLTEPQCLGLEALARQVETHLEMHRLLHSNAAMSEAKLAQSAADLSDERETAQLREQFIAIMGHDLRNPLGAISSGLHLIQRTALTEKASKITTMMQGSVLRMTELITNVLDFARGRLGGGMALQLRSDEALQPIIEHVVHELSSTRPGSQVVTQFDLTEPVTCDPDRIGQLLSNLLSNAMTYGDRTRPILVTAGTANGLFELSVANCGTPIPQATQQQLFKPYARGGATDRQGLGLGLYISSEIARAHNGRIDVTSTDEETCFTLRMPLSIGETAPTM